MSNHVLVLSGHLFPSGSCLQEWPRWSAQVPRQLDLISQDSPQLLHSWRTPILLWWSPSDLGSYWWTPSLRGIYYPRQFHLRQCHLRIFTQRYYTKVYKTSFSFLLAEIPYAKFMFFYALRNELLRSGTEFTRFYLVRNWIYPKKRVNSVPRNWISPFFRVSSVPD